MNGATSPEPARAAPGTFPVFIALGSNIEPAAHLPRAVELLGERFALRAVSRVYESEPVGAAGAPPFLNAAVLITTNLAPRALKFDVLRPMEARLGRVRTEDRNAPRTLDLDLVLYADLILEDATRHITLPDPEILTRAHLALPLADLAPTFRHPVTGEALSTIAARFAATPGIRVSRLGLPAPPGG